MEKELIKVVEGYFDESSKVKNKEIIQEVSSNLIERYKELVDEGLSEKEAYEKCLVYLGNLNSISKSNIDIKTLEEKPLSIYFVFLISIASVFLFFVNTISALFLSLLGLAVFSIEYKRQYLIYQADQKKVFAFRFLTKIHKILVLILGLTWALIIMEVVFVLFSNLDKLLFSLIFKSEPRGLMLSLFVVFYLIILVPIFAYHNKVVSNYEELSGEKVREFKLPLLFQKSISFGNYVKYMKISYSSMSLLTVLNLLVTLFSKVLRYGLAFDPDTNEIIGWRLTGSQPLWQHILNNSFNFGAWALTIIGVLIVITLVSGIFVKQFRQYKIILSINFLWFVSMLIYAFNYALYTGIKYSMSANISYSLGVLLIICAFMILNRNWKVLFYDTEKQ